MDTFRVPIEFGDTQGQRWSRVEALVDTGAGYSWLPSSVLCSLGVAPTMRFPFVMADGRRVEKEMAETRVRLNG